MKTKSIYLILKGRIGNQLFIYAFAREIQKRLGNDTEIIIDDSEVLSMNWEDALTYYNLQNVKFVHSRNEAKTKKWIFRYILLKIAERFCTFRKSSYIKKFKKEKILKPFLSMFGIFLCENGFMKFKIGHKNKYMLCGYFQSEKYFENVKDKLKDLVRLNGSLDYPNLGELKNNESICISIKIEHNVGSSLYAVCGKEYWQEAIDYILAQVKNPVFFICSDDVEYVKKNLIDCTKYKVIFQDKAQPVYKSLAAMTYCKHFIIGNSSFSWWAQYAAKSPNKITVAPNQWMLVDMPIDIYQNGWHLIDVKKYTEAK